MTESTTVPSIARADSGRRKPSIADWLFEPVDIASLVFFRIAFGALLLALFGYYIRVNWIELIYLSPKIRFPYDGLEWIKPWPGGGMYYHHILMAVLAMMIMIGLFYRLATALFCLSWTYFFLIDEASYQNHIYMIGLMSFLMIFVPAHRACSVDVRMRPRLRVDRVPAWTLWLVRFQFFVVYFYGGVAKLNADWLGGASMGLALQKNLDFPLIGRWFDEHWMALFFARAGTLFDLFIIPAMLWRPTRLLAFAAALIFNLTNSKMYDIDIFPYLMLAGTALYFPPHWPRRFFSRFQRVSHASASQVPARGPSRFARRMTVCALGLYGAIQLFLPLRHFLYPSNVDWTGKGSLFAWRMRLASHTLHLRYLATNPKTGTTSVIIPRWYATAWQVGALNDPALLLRLAHDIGADLNRKGLGPVQIRAHCKVELNGREPRVLIDPEVDLTTIDRGQGLSSWVLPWDYEPQPVITLPNANEFNEL